MRVSRLCAVLLVGTSLIAGSALAELPADVQSKVDTYKKKMVTWAANPQIVAAARDASRKPDAGMTNGKWDELEDNSQPVKQTTESAVSGVLKDLEKDNNINKLFLRDAKGNVVAGTNKTMLFNASTRPHIASALKGTVAQAKEIKPDPSTQVKSVQVAVPVFDGDKVIGVLHTAVTAQ